MLKLRSIALSDYSVLEGKQRIGRIRLATERMPCVWRWSVAIHLTGDLPMGSAQDLDTAKAEFAGAWTALKVRTSPEEVRTVTEPSRLTSMDRIYLAIIASAILLMIGAFSLHMTRTADLMPGARTIGAARLFK